MVDMADHGIVCFESTTHLGGDLPKGFPLSIQVQDHFSCKFSFETLSTISAEIYVGFKVGNTIRSEILAVPQVGN